MQLSSIFGFGNAADTWQRHQFIRGDAFQCLFGAAADSIGVQRLRDAVGAEEVVFIVNHAVHDFGSSLFWIHALEHIGRRGTRGSLEHGVVGRDSTGLSLQ
ncbi:hypothetical protein D3C84_797550 [compost metagenome]